MAEPTTNNANGNDGANGNNGNAAGGNQNPPPNANNKKDGDGNEITLRGKRLAGALLILLTLFSGLYLIAHWPDRLVSPHDEIKPLYTYGWFHVRLVGIPDSSGIDFINDSIFLKKSTAMANQKTPGSDITDTSGITDSMQLSITKQHNDSVKKAASTRQSVTTRFPPESSLMHINTLLLILVAIAGFLGNMIYVATSFTTFIGNGQYRKSWGLWYFVKPVTASALAIAIYFVFRGGFLNMSDDSTNINLYGLMTISILAGLFTDRTTLKLKEVFDVLLHPEEKEKRRGQLTDESPQLASIEAEDLEVGKTVMVKLLGKNFTKDLVVKVEGQQVVVSDVQPTTITFAYTLADELKDKDTLMVQIFDKDGKPVEASRQLIVKKAANANAGPVPPAQDGASNGGEEANDETLNQEEFGDADTADTEDDINKPQD